MADTGKILIVLGIAITLAGVLIWALSRAGFKGLPGDVAYEGQNVRVYFPIVTCIVISVLLTCGAWVWRWLSGK